MVDLPPTWRPWLQGPKLYSHMVKVFFILCQSIPLDLDMLTALAKFDYRMILVLLDADPYLAPHYPYLAPHYPRHEIDVDQFLENVFCAHYLVC